MSRQLVRRIGQALRRYEATERVQRARRELLRRLLDPATPESVRVGLVEFHLNQPIDFDPDEIARRRARKRARRRRLDPDEIARRRARKRLRQCLQSRIDVRLVATATARARANVGNGPRQRPESPP